MDLPFAKEVLAWKVRRASQQHPVSPLEDFKLASVQRVMLVLTTGIGDAIFSSVVFPSVRQALPKAKIGLFCRSAWHDLFRADPNIDVLLPYPGKFRQFFNTLERLRDFAPDLTIILHANDPDIIPMCYLAGSRFIVRIPVTSTHFDYLLSNRNRPEDQTPLPGVHYVDNRVRILDTLGIPVVTRAPAIHLEPALVQAISEKLSAHFGQRAYWVLHIHAADPYKTLPQDIARTLIHQALERFPDHALVLSGGPENRADLSALVPKDKQNQVFVAAGIFNLAESAACLARAAIIVAPDTGILHLAAALDRPVIGLFAPTQSALVGPRPPTAEVQVLQKPLTCDPCPQKKCPHRPVKCMMQFTSDEILSALSSRLSP